MYKRQLTGELYRDGEDQESELWNGFDLAEYEEIIQSAIDSANTPVSYTHLDVYKRQVCNQIAQLVGMPHGNGFCSNHSIHGLSPNVPPVEAFSPEMCIRDSPGRRLDTQTLCLRRKEKGWRLKWASA